MRAVLPLLLILAGEAHEHFVDECGRLLRVSRLLAFHLPAGHAPQLRVHERRERVERGAVAAAPVREKARDVFRRCQGVLDGSHKFFLR